MFNDLNEVLKIIHFITGYGDGKIAQRIKYSRSHLNVLKKNGGGEDVAVLLNEAFKKEIQLFVRKYSNLKGGDQPNSNSQIQIHSQPEDLQRIALDLDKLAQSVKRIYETMSSVQLSKSDIESRKAQKGIPNVEHKHGKGQKGQASR